MRVASDNGRYVFSGFASKINLTDGMDFPRNFRRLVANQSCGVCLKLAGVAFGYLYWKRGLEAAMLRHMSAHLVMQIPDVMLLKTML